MKKQMPLFKKWTVGLILALFVVWLFWYCNCIPDRLFSSPTSTVLLDKDGNLLGAQIAADGQWRFSPIDSVPKRFEKCLLEFEDRTFYDHYGISVRGIGRAIFQNLRKRRVVSGGSTLTMQLARIMRKNPPRTFTEKVIEMFIATRLEVRFDKSEILNYYVSNAPFGNNVVGLDAAAWRYFGRSAHRLSWAESATLAVLPNAPGLIYPGKNHARLLEKRNRLLKRLCEIKAIDQSTYELSVSEPLPDKPLALPRESPHLLARLIQKGYKGQTIHSSVDVGLQQKANAILQAHSERLQENRIHNGAVIITSVKTGNILAYVGNTRSEDADQSCDVDCINAARSTGSILKPFLYMKCLQDGQITPNSLVQDIPSQFGNFSPKNFAASYDGAVPAGKALARSLNIPMVKMLNEYGLEKFHQDLKHAGITTLNKPARHYGLSLILGGAEAKLWDLNTAYSHLAQELRYGETKEINVVTGRHKKEKKRKQTYSFSKNDKACIYTTFEAMVDVNRPDEDGNWRAFASAQKIAWKTGTSFGFRDAWAIGVTPDYVVSVWIGNADGEGRPGLTGIKAAAPVLFDIFDQLPKSQHWFLAPREEMCRTAICRESGCRASDICGEADSVWIPKTCMNTTACPYHKIIHLSKNTKQRVDSDCESINNMEHVPWFVLPPLVERYYKFNHPNYKIVPEFKTECLSKVSDRALAILYPKQNSKIYVPVEIDGNIGRTVFEAAHRNVSTKVYWHLDDEFIGETTEIHQMALNPSLGKHKLILVDENGISVSVKFEAIGKTGNGS